MNPDVRPGLGGVAVLDRVGQQVHHDQLDAARVGHERRQIVGNLEADAAGIGHVLQLAGHVVYEGAEVDVLLVGRAFVAPRQPGQAFEFAGDVGEPYDVTFERVDQASALEISWRRLDDAGEHLQHAERLANLVADQPREAAQLGGLPLDGFRVRGNEGVDRLPLQHPDRLLSATQHQHGCGGVRAFGEYRGLSREETLDHFAEQLVLAQQLVHRGALVEAHQTELGGLGHHCGVGGDLVVGRGAQVGGDVDDQFRNVIEQLVCGEYLVTGQIDDLVQPIQPCVGQGRMFGLEARGEVLDGGGEFGRGHGAVQPTGGPLKCSASCALASILLRAERTVRSLIHAESN